MIIRSHLTAWVDSLCAYRKEVITLRSEGIWICIDFSVAAAKLSVDAYTCERIPGHTHSVQRIYNSEKHKKYKVSGFKVCSRFNDGHVVFICTFFKWRTEYYNNAPKFLLSSISILLWISQDSPYASARANWQGFIVNEFPHVDDISSRAGI